MPDSPTNTASAHTNVRVRRARATIPVVALGVAGLLAGCGGSAHSSTTASTAAQQTSGTQGVASTGTVVTVKHHGATDGTLGGSGSAHVTAEQAKHGGQSSPSAVAAKPVAPVIPAGPVIQTYSGVGDGVIGSVKEHSTTVLEWSTPKPPIQLFTARGFLLLDSAAPNGRIRLGRGSYSGLRVAAKGSWTIRVRAAA